MAYDAFISYSHGADLDLAPAIRDGLQRLAKPWHKRRALSIFLDQASLELSSELGGSLDERIEDTRWLVLFMSEQSAQSRWVGEEIALWAAKKSKQHIALVLTSGEVVWDDVAKDFDYERSTAVSEGMRGVYTGQDSEPLFLDLRWTKALTEGEKPLDLNHLKFRDAIATLAAPIHGIPKDELEGEDVRQYKLFRRLRRAAVSGLVMLTVLAVGAGIFAWKKRNEAIVQRDRSEARRLAAVSEANAAEQTDLATLLALESLRVKETSEGWGALFATLSRSVFARSPMTGHERKVNQVAFSPDGKWLASASDDGTVRLWNVATGQYVRQFIGHQHPKHPEIMIEVKAVAFSPDSGLVASGDSFGRVMLWDPESGAKLGETLTGHTNGVMALAFGEDETSLASAGGGRLGKGEVHLWHLNSTGAQAGKILTGHQGEVRSVVFLGTSTLMSAGADGTVRVWDTAKGSEVTQLLPRQQGWGGVLEFSPDSTKLAVANLDWTVQLWDLELGEPIGKPFTGHDGEVFSAAFSAYGKRLATASLDRTIRIWDLSSDQHQQIGEPLTGHKGEVSWVTFSPDASLLATASLDGTVRLWDLTFGATVGEQLTKGESLPRVAMSLDGSRLASASSDGMVRVWDLATRSMMGESDAHDSATRVALNADGSRLASGGFDGTVLLWSVDSDGLELSGRPTAHDYLITGLAFSTDAMSKLASASADGVVRLWNVALAQEMSATANGHDGAVPSLVFSPNGSRLVSVGFDSTIRMWDMGLKPVGEAFTGHEDLVWDAVFNDDGTQLTSVGKDGTVRRWDVASGKQSGEPLISRPDQWVGPAVFSPEGTRLVTATSDGTLRLWEVASGQMIGVPLPGHGSEVTDMAFSREAALLVSASSDGTLRLWPALDRWIKRACEDVGRNLSLTEWTKFVGTNRSYQRQCSHPSGLGAPEVQDPVYELEFK